MPTQIQPGAHPKLTEARHFTGSTALGQPAIAAPGLIPGAWVIVVLCVSTLAASLMLFGTGLFVAPRTVGFTAALACMAGLVLVRTVVHFLASPLHKALRDFTEDLFAFVTISLLGGVITPALFPPFPAEGPLAYLWRGPIPYMPISAL